MKPVLVATAVVASAAFAVPPVGAASAVEPPREFDLALRVVFPPAGKGARTMRVWLPVPQVRREQAAERLAVVSPFPHRITVEPEYGNRMLYAEGPAPGSPVRFEMTWRVRRLVQRAPEAGPAVAAAAPRCLEPRGMVAVTDEIRGLAERRLRGASGRMTRARELYDLVLERMVYDKSGAGWGRGDAFHACAVGKGNCTDFHSLFMALSVAAGIPSRFNIGFPVPAGGEGTLKGYHCWAEFHHPGRGWVPVDISEAWKRDERREFYFGSLDADRVLLSTGREVMLAPEQDGMRLNWFLEPYAEVDGRETAASETTWTYREVRSKKGGAI